MTTLTTREQLAADIAALSKANPGKRNPTNDDGKCVYTHPTKPEWHCIIGEVATQRGWQIRNTVESLPPGRPTRYTPSADHLADRLGWPIDASTRQWLSRVQEGYDDDERTWGEALGFCQDRGLL